MLFGKHTHLFGCHVPGHHQYRVVGRIEPVVEIQNIIHLQPDHLMHPTDDWHAVAMIDVKRCPHALIKEAGWVVLNTLVPLFDNDIAFRDDVLLGEPQVLHPVGFHLHHQTKPVCSHALKVGRVIKRRKCVITTAVTRHGRRQLALLHRVGAFEHQVFQKV